jgi:hypothetical protein
MTDYRRIPASHAACILGTLEWGTPLATYLACREGHPFRENPEEPKKGVRLKPALRTWVGDLIEREVPAVRSATFSNAGKLAFLSAQPDGLTANGDTALLLRTPIDLERWSVTDEESEDVHLTMPQDVRVECAVTRMVLKANEVVVGVLRGGQMSILSYTEEPDFEQRLLTFLGMWWRNTVEAGRVPRAQLGDEKLLRQLFPKPTREKPVDYRSLPPHYQEAVLKFCAAQRQRTAAQKIEKETRPIVVQALGDFPGMADFPADSGIASISFEERAPHANNATWKGISTELLEKMSPQRRAKMLKKHTPEVGTRVLRPFFVKAEQVAA